MHLEEGAHQLFQKHKDDLEEMGVELLEETLEPDYHGEGEDSVYQMYRVKPKSDKKAVNF